MEKERLEILEKCMYAITKAFMPYDLTPVEIFACLIANLAGFCIAADIPKEEVIEFLNLRWEDATKAYHATGD